jgi:hypothetical protein
MAWQSNVPKSCDCGTILRLIFLSCPIRLQHLRISDTVRRSPVAALTPETAMSDDFAYSRS